MPLDHGRFPRFIGGGGEFKTPRTPNRMAQAGVAERFNAPALSSGKPVKGFLGRSELVPRKGLGSSNARLFFRKEKGRRAKRKRAENLPPGVLLFSVKRV